MNDERQPGLTRLDEDRAESMADEGGAAAAAVEAGPSHPPTHGLDAFFPDTPDETPDDERD